MEIFYVYATAALIVGLFVVQVATKTFDPFAPIWLFLVGYLQIYVVQAISYHEWAMQLRGPEVIGAANLRALWALAWFMLIYHSGIGRLLSAFLPRPPGAWSVGTVGMISPVLVAWGLVCAGMVIRSSGGSSDDAMGEEMIFRSFPYVMLIAAVLLVLTARSGGQYRPGFLYSGLAIAGCFTLIWMFNGKRSLSLMGVLATTCAFYISKKTRPSWPVLLTTGLLAGFAVTVAIGWRNDRDHDRSFAGFFDFLGSMRPDSILKNINIDVEDHGGAYVSHETEEYGGYILMMDVVPDRAEYDYGTNYCRIFSTFIPRLLWPNKPLYGREQWVNAWIAGSELERDSSFTGPAIGILGATQLNGGAWGTAIVLGCLALVLRTAYDYFRRYSGNPLVQTFWAVTFTNAWFMVVGDDPLNWFYYNWGFTTMPILVFLWAVNKFAPQPAVSFQPSAIA